MSGCDGIRIFCGSSTKKIGINRSAAVIDTLICAVEIPILGLLEQRIETTLRVVSILMG